MVEIFSYFWIVAFSLWTLKGRVCREAERPGGREVREAERAEKQGGKEAERQRSVEAGR